MPRSLTSRALGFATAMWFVALSTELAAFDSCDVHGRDAPGRGARVAIAVHGHHGVPSRQGAPTEHGKQCTCLGSGCCGTATGLAAAGECVVPPGTTITLTGSPPAARLVARADSPDHLLPPAIGPPALHAGSLT